MASFLDLPDELILKVFSYTETVDLWRCGQVSKRIRNISNDNSLIQTRSFRDLPEEVILKVFSYTEIEDLLSCGQVSKRFRAISNAGMAEAGGRWGVRPPRFWQNRRRRQEAARRRAALLST